MKLASIVLVIIGLCSCSVKNEIQSGFAGLTTELSKQIHVLVDIIPDGLVPRSYPDEKGGYRLVGNNDWTCGFPAGSFWLLYELTGDEFWKQTAVENTVKLEGVQFLTNTHDLGFMVFCSYGNAYRITGSEQFKKVILEASETLIKRFNPTTRAIRSWDFGNWQYPVIVDNMMNLEMLFWASKATGDEKFREIAISHADVTLENHYREDWSSVHVVSYDTVTGKPIEKQTHQGFSHASAWARGQAWGFYGYTMCYRETGYKRYLEAAENIGKFLLNNLPEDNVFYWDFNDPAIPDAPRDASATAITASALFELSTLSEKGDVWLQAANRIMERLTSDHYRATGGTNGGFILKHSVGNFPASSEIDVAINYADYYYLEALKRQQELQN